MSATVDARHDAGEAEAELRQLLVARLGEARARELADLLRATAAEIALVEATVLEIEQEEPDFARPPA